MRIKVQKDSKENAIVGPSVITVEGKPIVDGYE